MLAIQLEFNLDNKTAEQLALVDMQKQIEEMMDSLGKVRRKIFSEVGEIKKLCATLQRENEELRLIVSALQE